MSGAISGGGDRLTKATVAPPTDNHAATAWPDKTLGAAIDHGMAQGDDALPAQAPSVYRTEVKPVRCNAPSNTSFHPVRQGASLREEARNAASHPLMGFM
ncbi:hypothetical protein GCM10009555_064580 [Acrocarpospora macrocephala]|uniref:Uncharacterized protein n=1 Tax=Acrocarpospora macrocephala TaxID=150177 RepID=A0A5M3WMR1_9ACTN|nr:hypothetical protein Amac_012030 [Acrocarpospora macrocephala]